AAKGIEIQGGRFRLIDENLERPKILDFRTVGIRSRDFQILGPEVSLGIDALSFEADRGLRVKKLAADFTYSREQMRFDSLQIDTDQSSLRGNLVFHYAREDLADFLDKVRLEGEFTESTVAFNEVNAYFDEFGRDRVVTFSSQIGGTLNRLRMDRLMLFTDHTGIRGDFGFDNLFAPDIPFELRGEIDNITSSYYQLRALLPNILGKNIPAKIQELGQFTVRGDMRVTETSVDAKVNLNTAIGNSYVDLRMADLQSGNNATYSGFISLMDFDLGNFINDQEFGLTSLDMNVEGQGTTAQTINTEI